MAAINRTEPCEGIETTVELAWLTDAHLNFLDATQLGELCETITASTADALLLGGDIAEAPTLPRYLRRLAGSYLPVYFVLGNHDYYHGSVWHVRHAAAALSRKLPALHWLPECGPVRLSDCTTLIGHGGWGDGRLGDFSCSRVRLNDYKLIKELAGHRGPDLLDRLQELGDEAAFIVSRQLTAALRLPAHQILMLTHVPPFREACWHGGKPSSDSWTPHFTCGAVGSVLERLMSAHPDHQLTVLSGHTHCAARAQILPNLEVITGAAEYGAPALQAPVRMP